MSGNRRLLWIVAIIIIVALVATSSYSVGVDAKKSKKEKSSSEATATGTSGTGVGLSKASKEEDDSASIARAAEEAATAAAEAQRIADDEAAAAAAAVKPKKKKSERALKKQAERLDKARRRNKKWADDRRARINKSRDEKKKEIAVADRKAKRRAEGDTPVNRARGTARLNWLIRNSARASNGIISMDEDNFNEYVNSSPRPYYLFLAFTAIRPEQQCPICQMIHEQTITIASAYEAKRNGTAMTAIASGALQVNEIDQPLFFAEIDASRNQLLFKKLSLQHAPFLILVPPETGNRTGKANEFMSSIKGKYKFMNMQPSTSSSDIAGFINKLRPSAITPVVVETVVQTGVLAIYTILLIIACIILYFYGEVLMAWFRKNRTFFLVVGYCMYLFGMSGGMYNIIRETPFSRRSEDGQEGYISGSSREQYGAEGYMMGAAHLFCAFALVLMNRGAFERDNGDKNRNRSTFGKIIAPIRVLAGAFLSPFVCLLVAAFFWYCVIAVYTRKNWMYQYGWLIGQS